MLYEPECFDHVDKRMIYTNIICGVAVLYDLCICVFFVGIENQEEFLALVHHIVAFSGCFATIYTGFGMVSMGQLIVLTEVSSIVLNCRFLLVKEEFGKPIGMFINMMFLLTYIVFRVILLPFVCFKMYDVYLKGWDLMSASRQCTLMYAAAQLALLTVLNYFWFYKVLMMAGRSMGLVGAKTKPKKVE